jgi:tetratricopeptide (TPR) repeat protein
MYNQSLKLDSLNFDTYLDLGVTYSIMGKPDLAIMNYNKAYHFDTASEKLLQNRAYTYFSAKQFALAVTDYNHLIRINPTPEYYFYRGQAEHNSGDFMHAIADYQKSLSMKAGNPDCMYDLSLAYNSVKDYSNALSFAVKAKQSGFKVPDVYIAQLQKSANSY